MGALIRHYLHVEPDQDPDSLLKQYVEALWIEDRLATVFAGAVAKAMGGK